MAILLKNIKLYDPSHQMHEQRTDILVESGKIITIGNPAQPLNDVIKIKGDELSVSIGWADMNCALSEPGFEHKETFTELCTNAIKGGFTDVAVLPNTLPVVDTAQAVDYIKQQTSLSEVNLHPIAAYSKQVKGKELSEILDLHKRGVNVFSDGTTNTEVNSILGKALRYLQPFSGLLIGYFEECDLSQNGHMHEGRMSTLLGMKGIPAIAEEVAIMKALKILEYYGGRLHFSTISTAGSVALIREAKAKRLAVTCDVAAYQFALTDTALENFDTYLKVKPPFREQVDNEAILVGLKDGTIDALVSNHRPQDTESKQLEFDLADFGIISLETAFSIARTKSQGKLTMATLIEKIASNPRKLVGLPHTLEIGKSASLTIFHEDLEWTYLASDINVRAKNSPFLGEKLIGKPLGIINGNKYFFSETLTSNYLSN